MGARFWIVLMATVVAGAVAAVIVLWLIGAALVAWGLLGAMLVFSAIALAFGWIYDRRRPPRLERI